MNRGFLLNRLEKANTVAELAKNLELSGLSVEELAARAGLDLRTTRDTLRLEPGCNPAYVWLLRDKLETAVKEGGGEPYPFSKLTEEARRAARGWFGVRDEH
ncbi:MAG: DUF2316 family protein [Winkia neuii]|uniref:DUF2316 family protein n=1 Tax=Winkia neuii TaxID=33007 RepID=UPI0007989371|nr:DUF2316 family protein [Winkia neuii]KWZ72444.1 hypothetical protein HMPREF3198_01800 [Winkia neuii]MDK8099622.1 DUF2316 family protein [Winkia neuii]MDU3135025.1 DUF2316 family protein [Winkia neuii]